MEDYKVTFAYVVDDGKESWTEFRSTIIRAESAGEAFAKADEQCPEGEVMWVHSIERVTE